jgi:hypothetical protein
LSRGSGFETHNTARFGRFDGRESVVAATAAAPDVQYYQQRRDRERYGFGQEW